MDKKTIALAVGLALSNPLSFYFGARMGERYPMEIRQHQGWMSYGTYKSAPGFHPDPWNLRINYHVNRKKQLEVYLVDRVKGKGAPIGDDVYPPSQDMCRKLIEKGIVSATDVNIPETVVKGAAYSATSGLVRKLW